MKRWIRNIIGISKLAIRITSCENRLEAIENLVQVGVDQHFKTPSWMVVCLKGKNQDIVRFFDLPDTEVAHMYELLKEMERRYRIHPVWDCSREIKSYFKW